MFLTQCHCFHLLSQSLLSCLQGSCVSKTNPPSILCRGFLCLDFSAPPTLYTVQVFLGFLQPHPPLYCLCFWGLLCFSALCVSGLLCFLHFSALYTVCVSGVSCVSCVSQPFIQSVYRGFRSPCNFQARMKHRKSRECKFKS